MSASKNQIAKGISCHCWNGARDHIALSPNSSEIKIYATNGSQDPTTWTLKWTLDEHTGYVSGMDWEPKSNQIVSVGHDRNGYVWKYHEQEDTWKPTLVLLRINRAATCVKWSPDGNKFAVASGMKCVPICHFESSNDWWVSKTIKKHKSTVLSLDWCANNKFIVTGSTDNKCRIFSAYVKGVDSAEDDGFGAIFPNQHKFGDVLAEFNTARSWINSVAWSPNGFRVAFAAHNSSVNFVAIQAGVEPSVKTVAYKGLPFLDLAFVGDDTLIGAGFDCTPVAFKASGEAADPDWSFEKELDTKDGAAKAAPKKAGGFSAARAMFSNAADRGQDKEESSSSNTVLKTKHQNTITSLSVAGEALLTSVGLDGQIHFWKV